MTDDIEKRLNRSMLAIAQAERAALGARINFDRLVLEAASKLTLDLTLDGDKDEIQLATLFEGLAAASQLVADAYKAVADFYTEARKIGADMDAELKELG